VTQFQLPLFQDGVNLITPHLGYQKSDGQILYLNGMTPVFIHDEGDIASFKMIVSQFYLNGAAKQAQLVKAFGINPLALKRWVKRAREHGPKCFYEPGKRRPRTAKKKPLPNP